MAYLLGYYDGDGIVRSKAICSASKEFLECIKKKYKLSYKVSCSFNNLYVMNLGNNLFSKMISNYSYSLKRKRKPSSFFVKKDLCGCKKLKHTRSQTCIMCFKKKNKLIGKYISKKELMIAMKDKSFTQIGKELGISGNAVKGRAIRFGIY